MLKKAVLMATTAYILTKKKAQCSPQPPLSNILRGAYENKIRRYSPPEKIFDVFATMYEKGELLMSMTDMLKAICFYNFSVSDQSKIEGFLPRNIVKFLGKDTKFEIYDYFILARFLVYEKERVEAYFKKNNIASITMADFEKFLIQEVCADYVDHIKQSILIESRQFKPSKEQFEKKIHQVSVSMFQNRKTMNFQKIQQYRKRMVEQLYQFEFLMFPVQDGKIDGVDFARSIVKYIEPSKTKKFMKRIKHMEDLEKIKIDMNGYKAFHLYLWANFNQIQKLLNERGAISTKQLSELIKGDVTTDQIDVVIKILDHDNSGFLEKKEVLGVLKNLQYYTSVKSGENSLVESLKQDLDRFVNKFHRIKDIVTE